MEFGSSGGGDALLALTFLWALFVFAFMVSVWGHLGALRRRLAPGQNPLVWDRVGERFGVAVPLLQPMYGIYERGGGTWPVEVFPFTMDGREAARTRWEQMESTPPATT